MLEQALFLLFLNPAFPESGELYDSGLKEVEHSYVSDRPATDYPIITIDFMLQDSLYNIVRPGIYAVDPSPDLKMLLLLQGDKIIARCPVVQVIELKPGQPVPEAKIGFIQNNKVFIIYKKDNLEVQGILHLLNPTEALD